MTRSRNGTPVLADTAELKPSGRVLFDDPITDPGEHCVSIAVEGGPSGMHPWDVPRRADPAQLTVVIRSDSISFIEVIA
ncbi:hypothetical protein EFA46_014625 (plasmid) [Halarchaeum sp. CBA1220]|uniref:hypothetical protein n=1 Tax=Halarchaeum sp. CBA1220 TaxID=1853682 RepID=UPI0011CDD277|nr:hypothetical protein [Halarchaeum sp. CBA1220]QLC35477.1 hypothetical protein EFA46_014625 [Halarchaeum sp. CBA1220]